MSDQEINHNEIYENIDEINIDILKKAYIDLCNINMDTNNTYLKLKKEHKQLQKKIELLLDLYIMDKSVLQFNNVELGENEEIETITQTCKRLKINSKIITKSKKTIPKKISIKLKEKMNIIEKEPELKKQLFMFTKNNNGLIQAHLSYKNNIETYKELQHIPNEFILFSTTASIELNDKIINELYKLNIINSNSVLIFNENIEDGFKKKYIELFNEYNNNNEFELTENKLNFFIFQNQN